jgi:hypothetical protein
MRAWYAARAPETTILPPPGGEPPCNSYVARRQGLREKLVGLSYACFWKLNERERSQIP